MSDKITDDLADKLRTSLEGGISDDSMKAIKKKLQDLFYEIETDIDYRLKDDLAPNLTAYTVDMAEKIVKALLAGNQHEMARYLGCEPGRWTGRSADQSWNPQPVERFHSVIHGKLFEHDPLSLRKAIVAAHRDLIESQRILDLEDQVASLVIQNNNLTDRLERAGEELRDYRRGDAA